jgi:isocitrate/isopropylmalate dehydrogenase
VVAARSIRLAVTGGDGIGPEVVRDDIAERVAG